MRIKSYCINLERAIERKKSFEKNWRGILGERLEYFVAVDGRNLLANDYLSNTQLACLRSHLSLMEKALRTEEDFFLILEDDAIPEYDNILGIIEYIYKSTGGCDILICCLRERYVVFLKKILHIPEDEFKILNNMADYYSEGTCAVFYTRKGLKDYIHHFSQETFCADMYGTLPKEVNTAFIVPALVSHRDIDSYISENYGRIFIK